MARARLLKPGFFRNEHLAELPPLTRLLFAGLWTIADRAGRLEDRPKRIKADLLPWDDAVDCHVLLAQLDAAGFITRYAVDGVMFIQIDKFAHHQHPHQREPESLIPEIPSNYAKPSAGLVLGTALHGTGPAESESESESVTESESDTVTPTVECSEAGKPPAEPVVAWMWFPCVGREKAWPLVPKQIQAWHEQYPHMDIEAELRKAEAWLEADPRRRKSAKGMPRFLVGWFNRAADRRQSSRHAQPTSYRPSQHEAYDRWPEECRRLHDGECGNYQTHQIRLSRDARPS